MNASVSHACRSVDTYEVLEPVGAGTFGSVYRARNRATGAIVALKSLKMEKARPHTEEEGLPYRALREITTLHAAAQNRHIVHLLEVVVGRGPYDIYLVLEYVEHDLARLVDSAKGSPFRAAEVKCIMLQLLDALHYLHDTLHVMHRDIKCSNILVHNKPRTRYYHYCQLATTTTTTTATAIRNNMPYV